MRLRPGLAVLWRSPTQVQLGTDPRWAATVTDLSPCAAQALRGLTAWTEIRALRAGLARQDVPSAEVETLVDHLRAARLLVDGPSNDRSADAATWSLLSADGDGSAVLTRRARATVRVSGLGRLGTGLAAIVAAGGVGVVELDDDRLVGPDDVGAGGLTARDIGAQRTAAAARVVHDAAPNVRTTGPGREPVDLAVVVEHEVADPVRYRTLMDDDVPHLSVVVREASVLVGPLVVPGHSACLRCADLHRAGRDPAWAVVAAQLAGRGRRRQSEETSMAAVAAALGAAQVLAHVDGRPSAVVGASLEIRLPDLLPRRVARPAHPDCGCRGPGPVA